MNSKALLMAFVIGAVLAWSESSAKKPFRPIDFDVIKGQWVGQAPGGDVLSLNLTSRSTGTFAYVDPRDDAESATTYNLSEIEFDGVRLAIRVDDRSFGPIVLKGLARESYMSLDITGFYVRSKPRVVFVRPAAWSGALERLRDGMKP